MRLPKYLTFLRSLASYLSIIVTFSSFALAEQVQKTATNPCDTKIEGEGPVDPVRCKKQTLDKCRNDFIEAKAKLSATCSEGGLTVEQCTSGDGSECLTDEDPEDRPEKCNFANQVGFRERKQEAESKRSECETKETKKKNLEEDIEKWDSQNEQNQLDAADKGKEIEQEFDEALKALRADFEGRHAQLDGIIAKTNAELTGLVNKKTASEIEYSRILDQAIVQCSSEATARVATLRKAKSDEIKSKTHTAGIYNIFGNKGKTIRARSKSLGKQASQFYQECLRGETEKGKVYVAAKQDVERRQEADRQQLTQLREALRNAIESALDEKEGLRPKEDQETQALRVKYQSKLEDLDRAQNLLRRRQQERNRLQANYVQANQELISCQVQLNELERFLTLPKGNFSSIDEGKFRLALEAGSIFEYRREACLSCFRDQDSPADGISFCQGPGASSTGAQLGEGARGDR